MSYAPLQSDLAQLSLRVAREVDRHLGGGSLDKSVLQNFSDRLSEVSGLSEPSTTQAFLHSDPQTTQLFADVVCSISLDPPSDLEKLGQSVGDYISSLSENVEALSERKLSDLKRFCLSLHRSIVSRQMPNVYDEEATFDESRFFGW